MRAGREYLVIAISALGLCGCTADTGDKGPLLGGEPRAFAFSLEEAPNMGPGYEFWLDATGHVDGHWTLLSMMDSRHCRGELTDGEWAELAARLNAVHALTRADSPGDPHTIDNRVWSVCVTPADAPAHCSTYTLPYEPLFDVDLFGFLRSVLARIDAAGACGPDSYPR